MLKARFLGNSWGKKGGDPSLLSLIFSPTMMVVLHKSVSFIKPLEQILSSFNLLECANEESKSSRAQKQCYT